MLSSLGGRTLPCFAKVSEIFTLLVSALLLLKFLVIAMSSFQVQDQSQVDYFTEIT